MLNASQLQAAARRQLNDYDRHVPGSIFAEGAVGWDLDEAYQLQLAVVELRKSRGETVAGYKIGCVSEVIRKQLGIAHPVIGHIFEGEIVATDSELYADRFDELAIEGEFAVRIAADVPDASSIAQHPARYVETIFPVIELHNAAIRGQQSSAVELVANNALQAGIVVPIHETPYQPLPACQIHVSINGAAQGSAATDALETLRELVERLAAIGLRLQKGQIALTGSPLPLYPLAPGDTVLVEADGMASVQVTVRS